MYGVRRLFAQLIDIFGSIGAGCPRYFTWWHCWLNCEQQFYLPNFILSAGSCRTLRSDSQQLMPSARLMAHHYIAHAWCWLTCNHWCAFGTRLASNWSLMFALTRALWFAFGERHLEWGVKLLNSSFIKSASYHSWRVGIHSKDCHVSGLHYQFFQKKGKVCKINIGKKRVDITTATL